MKLKTYFEKEFFVGGEEKIRDFANSIGDENPLHHNDETARKAGLLGIIAPGVMVVGFMSSTIASEIPGVMVRRLEVEFIDPTYAWSLVTVSCTVSRQRDRLALVAITVKNGFRMMAKGSCTLLLPRKAVESTTLAA